MDISINYKGKTYQSKEDLQVLKTILEKDELDQSRVSNTDDLSKLLELSHREHDKYVDEVSQYDKCIVECEKNIIHLNEEKQQHAADRRAILEEISRLNTEIDKLRLREQTAKKLIENADKKTDEVKKQHDELKTGHKRSYEEMTARKQKVDDTTRLLEESNSVHKKETVQKIQSTLSFVKMMLK